MVLSLVGLGLHDIGDLSLKGLKEIQAADEVVAEFYTAKLAGTSQEELEETVGRPIRVLDRLGVEQGIVSLIARAKDEHIVLLTAGDPMSATTHADILVRCHEAGVRTRIVHASSIFTAAPGLVGLQHYKFGRTTTLVRPEPNWLPTSPFDAVAANHASGLHTLVLLDIKADEGYYMTGPEGLELLLRLAEATDNAWFNLDTQAAVIARAGAPEPEIRTGTIRELIQHDFGAPLHCIIIPGPMQVVEEEAWRIYHGSPS